MDIVLLAMLALVTGALVFLFAEQRKFQRANPIEVLRQEDQERRNALRLERLEDLLGRLVEQERRKREETASALSEVRSAAFKLRQEIEELKRTTSNVPLLSSPEVKAVPVAGPNTESPAPVSKAAAVQNVTSENTLDKDDEDFYLPPVPASRTQAQPHHLPESGRAAAAGNLIQQGLDQQSVARQLGMSSHAVELINSLRGLKTA